MKGGFLKSAMAIKSNTAKSLPVSTSARIVGAIQKAEKIRIRSAEAPCTKSGCMC